MARTKNSAVMVIANHLVKEGYSRSKAMVKAWILVKLPALSVKVKGVTYGNRQRAIEHLTRYASEDIHISLERDSADCDAVDIHRLTKMMELSCPPPFTSPKTGKVGRFQKGSLWHLWQAEMQERKDRNHFLEGNGKIYL